MTKKKVSALFMAAVMAGSVLIGCGNKNEAPPASEAERPVSNEEKEEGAADGAVEGTGESSFEGRTLTLAHNYLDATMDGLNKQFEAFEQKYGCTVEVELLAEDGEEGERILLTRAATGNLPDVFCASSGAKLKEFAPAENVYDISGEAFVERLTDDYKAIVSGDNGEIYGVPLRPSNVAGVFYNKPAYEALGLEIPTTWEGLMANCQAIRENSDKDPIVAAYDGAAGCQILFLSQYYYVAQENPDFAQQYTNREIELADSSAYVRGLEKMYEMNEKGYLNTDPLSTSFDDSAIALAEGTAVHTFCRTNIVGTIENVAPDKVDDIGFFPLPDEKEEVLGVAVWLPQSWCISKNSENIDLALALFDFLASEEGIAAYCEGTEPAGIFAIKGFSLPDDVPQIIRDAQEWANKASTPVMEYSCDIKGANMATILSMVGTGEMTPEQGITEIAADNEIDARQRGIAGW